MLAKFSLEHHQTKDFTHEELLNEEETPLLSFALKTIIALILPDKRDL
jgi:hypothetical protein